MRIVVALALVASGALAVVAARRILTAPEVWNDQPLAWAKVAAAGVVLFAFAVLRWPHHAVAAATIAALVAAVAALTPGPVATVALLLFASWLGGRALKERLAPATLPFPIDVLVGVALAIGAFEVTAQFRVHYGPVHVGIALLIVVLCRERLRELPARALAWLATPQPTTQGERAWIVVAGVVFVVHVVVVAKPEVGYDASTMHLQFAELVAADHRFAYGVDRYLWAAMPLGADYAFATAYLAGGEPAARTMNLAFGALAAMLVYRLGRLAASREAALACTTLFASMPLAMLLTGSLFSETLWLAFLLAALAVVVDSTSRGTAWLPLLAILAGGAMATKAISLLWLLPLAAFAIHRAWRDRTLRAMRPRDWGVAALGIAIGAWPYAEAWITTGNPVFPFMNAVFRSPLYETAASFNNPHYNAPLTPWTPWQIVLDSGRYIEGRRGAIGLGWLFSIALVLLHFRRRRPLAHVLVATVAVVFFVAVYLQQSYLRYLLPSLALVAVLASFATSELLGSRGVRALVLVAGIALVALDLRNIAAAHHPHATPCTACLYDAAARERYVTTYAPLRAVAARLNRELPQARVGFLLPNDAAPAGYVGASRSGNWHDDAFFRGLVRAPSADAVLELVRTHGLTHVVHRATAEAAFPAIAEFAARHATPLWRVGDYVVASVRSDAGR